jgi:predicted phosphohydrolase
MTFFPISSRSMTIWAIADLHLGFGRDESRDRFGGRWREHADKIAAGWRAVVGRSDLVLVPGDISQARNSREVQADLAWIDHLPGRKVLSPGNNDAWWNGAAKVRPMLRRSTFCVDGDAIELDGVVIAGSAGAPVFDEDDALARSRFQAQAESLQRALDAAAGLRSDREIPIYVLWHYPPFDRFGTPGPIAEKLEQARVTACVYGHLHAQGQWGTAVQGMHGRVLYRCVASDALGFRPLRISSEGAVTP